jgi:hypothetical protein
METNKMKKILIASAALALFAGPVLAVEPQVDAQGSGGKPGSSANPSLNSAAKNEKAYDTTGSSGVSDGTVGVEPAPSAREERREMRDSSPAIHKDPGDRTSPPAGELK